MIHPDLRKTPDKILEFDVIDNQFIPNSQGMRTGQRLLFKNSSSDPCDFKYHLGDIAENVLVPSDKKHTTPGLKSHSHSLILGSSIRYWMKSYVRVFDHPYYAITDEDGRFEIRLAPVGTFRMWVWHPESGFRDGAKGKDGDLIDVKRRGTDIGVIKIRPLK